MRKCSARNASAGVSSRTRTRLAIALAALTGAGLYADSIRAASGTWIADAAGNWSDTTKWASGVIADGVDALADFSTIDLTAARNVTINTTSRTLGSIKVG